MSQEYAQPEFGVSIDPDRESYDYRWTNSHLLSFGLIAGALTLPLVVIRMDFALASNDLPENIAISAVLSVPIAILGIYYQLRGWNEKISLKGGMISWVDFLGRTRIKSPSSSILNLEYSRVGGLTSGPFEMLTISLPEGKFIVFNGLHDFGGFRTRMNQIFCGARAARGETNAG